MHALLLTLILLAGDIPAVQPAISRSAVTLFAPAAPLLPKREPMPRAIPHRPYTSFQPPRRPEIVLEPASLPIAPALSVTRTPALPLAPATQTPVVAPPPVPVMKVETGVFASNVPATAVSEPLRVNRNAGFSPSGLPETPIHTARTAIPDVSGFGDSTHRSPATPAATGISHSSGFAASSTGGWASSRMARGITDSGFGAMAPAASRLSSVPRPVAAAVESVQILQKPRPAYTEEARKLQIEGDVVLETVFTARGEVRIVRIVRGLGHGLDENALVAAQNIHFIPAQRDGRPIDLAGTIRVTFQLAY